MTLAALANMGEGYDSSVAQAEFSVCPRTEGPYIVQQRGTQFPEICEVRKNPVQLLCMAKGMCPDMRVCVSLFLLPYPNNSTSPLTVVPDANVFPLDRSSSVRCMTPWDPSEVLGITFWPDTHLEESRTTCTGWGEVGPMGRGVGRQQCEGQQ